MEKEFIPYEQVLALKKLGFDEEVEFYKDLSEEIFDMRTPNDAPCILWQQAFRWFREKHNLCGVITPQSYEIWGYPDGGCIIEQYPVHTYEEAELECLKKLIKIVKEK
jgi:hypothetical protein